MCANQSGTKPKQVIKKITETSYHYTLNDLPFQDVRVHFSWIFFSDQKTTYISYAFISYYDNINLNRLLVSLPHLSLKYLRTTF